MNVSGRVAVVTGGAGGIGSALARRLSAEGASVAVVDLDAARAGQTAAAVGGTAIGIGADVSDETQIAGLLERVERELGPVDLYFANAGVADGAGLAATEDEWSRALDVNVLAHVRAARLLLPRWLQRGEGYFVSTASAAGLLSELGSVTYSVSKHGAVAFAEWLSISYGDQGIRVSCLCPMGVDTAMLNQGLDAAGSEALGAKVVAAAGTVLAPDEVAEVVLAAVADERFLILPHPEVQEFERRKAADRDRWIAGMRRLARSVAPQAGTP